MLTLVETLYLLYIDELKGTTAKGIVGPLHYGLSSALLADLTIRGKLAVDKDRVVVTDKSPTGTELLDDSLELITSVHKPRKLSRWIASMPVNDLPRRTADSLVERRILKVEEKRYMWVFPYEAYTQQDASAKYWIKQHLRAVILAGEKPTPEDVVLLSLLHACSLLNLVFTRDERKSARNRINDLASNNIFGDSVTEVLDGIYAAMIATVASSTAYS